MSQSFIKVKFVREGFHCWPSAPPRRDYLRQMHRHLFHYVVCATVEHDDREIEFHDLLDLVKGLVKSKRLGSFSCERQARKIFDSLRITYPERAFSVEVLEDNECGATVGNLHS